MKLFSVTPNVDVTGWIVKLEDEVPEEEYEAKDDAITAAKQHAEKNTPSKVQILDKEHNTIDELTYK